MHSKNSAAREAKLDMGMSGLAVISTISAMMWRGVRNWPFWPAVAIFASMNS
jgi:hypothetical protein